MQSKKKKVYRNFLWNLISFNITTHLNNFWKERVLRLFKEIIPTFPKSKISHFQVKWHFYFLFISIYWGRTNYFEQMQSTSYSQTFMTGNKHSSTLSNFRIFFLLVVFLDHQRSSGTSQSCLAFLAFLATTTNKIDENFPCSSKKSEFRGVLCTLLICSHVSLIPN